MAVPFAVACYDDGFQAAVRGESGEEFGIPGADGEPRSQCRSWILRGDVAGEEGCHVVGDVVVEPREQGAGLFESGGERLGQGEGEGGQGPDLGPVELGEPRMIIWAGEVVAGEARERRL